MQEIARVGVRHRVALALVGTLVLVLMALLPFAVVSALWNVVGVPYDRVYSLTPAASSPTPSHSRLHVELIALDPAQRQVTLRVAGHHTCPPGCTWQDQVVFFSLRTDAPDAEGLPPSAAITLPSGTGELTQTIQLPVYGEPIRYPFDSYELWLGAVLQRVQPDGTVQTLTPGEAQGHLFLTVQNRLSLLFLQGPDESTTPQLVTVGDSPYEYLYTGRLVLRRPVWLPVLAVMLILLISAAAGYAVFLRPLHDLAIGAGSLVLGVWGIRSVLLPNNISYTTAVDLALSVVLLFLLGGTSARALLMLWDRNRLPLPRWARRTSAAREPASAQSPNGTGPPVGPPGGRSIRKRRGRRSAARRTRRSASWPSSHCAARPDRDT
jgi:hypothetical protein